jgi:DNA-binding IclR family transcriptional regulator
VQPELFRKGSLLPMMDELASAADATVVLASRVGLNVQYFHAVDPSGVVSGLKTGDVAPLLHSAAGKALLTSVSADQARKFAHRLNADADDAHRVRADDLIADLDQVRARGYAVHIEEEVASISVLLPQPHGDEQLALCIHTTRAVFDADEAHLVQLLRAAVARQGRRASDEAGFPVAQAPAVEPMLRRVG